MLKSLTIKLAQVPGNRWLAAYVVTLVVGAFGFAMLPTGSFYFPTARLEPSTGKYFDQLKSELDSVLNMGYLPPDSATLVAMQGWQPVPGRTWVEDVVIPEGIVNGSRLHHHEDIPLEIHMAIPIEKEMVNQGVLRCVGTLNVSSDALLLPFKSPPSTPDSSDFQQAGAYAWLPTRLKGVSFTMLRVGLAEPPVLEKAVQGYFVRQVIPQGARYTPAITLPPSTRLLLFKYVRAMLGFPTDLQDNLRRMAYLSAVTITTLGYGDIVPLTDSARLFTALEAVIGILLAGLFLNSLAGEIAGRTRSSVATAPVVAASDDSPQQTPGTSPPLRSMWWTSPDYS